MICRSGSACISDDCCSRLTQHAEIFPDLTSDIELQIALAIGPDNFYIRHRQSIADLFAGQTTGNESDQRLPISFNLATGELCCPL